MEKQTNEKLVQKLIERLRVAKTNAQEQNKKDKFPKLLIGGEERINQKYISNEQYFQIVQLYNFLKEYEDLTHEEFEEILKTKFGKFMFLRRLNKIVKNLDEELRDHGVRYVAIKFAEIKYSKDFFKHWLYS